MVAGAGYYCRSRCWYSLAPDSASEVYGEEKDAPVGLVYFDNECSAIGISGKKGDEVFALHLLHAGLIRYDFDVLSQA
jgi:hypothetical protein